MIGRESFISPLLGGGLLALSSGGLLLLLSGGVLSSGLGLRRGPESLLGVSKGWRNRGVCISSYQVVSEKLHDQGGVLVALLAQGIKLCDER